MLKIYKLRLGDTFDHAAQELKKYLRMMMPECGEIDIHYAPDAKDGFRLGLLQDFGLPNEAEDPVLDDIIHVDTTAEGGILAGSNPRSVLFSVYRLLKENVLLASISHGPRVEIPHGTSCIQAGDTVVVVTTQRGAIDTLNDIFA